MIFYLTQLLTVIILLVTFHPQLVNAESSLSDKITQNIKELCLAPSDKGKFWDINLKAGGCET